MATYFSRLNDFDGAKVGVFFVPSKQLVLNLC